ncbi:MAG: glutamate racemase [Gammaproteobacteria bacterium]|nr:glutamate racemase [Gammaproteobacteria bacterium]
MSSLPEYPIGVFDSGVGGLTVVHALRRQLPQENIYYFGDTARVPYGVKSDETIARFAAQIVEFLLEKRVKILVVACNTMAAVASQVIRALSPVPVLDVINAGARGAAQETRSKRVGVIGTLATVASGAYDQAIARHDPSIRVQSRACPLFVPLVEEGWLDHVVTRITAEEYLRPLCRDGIDTLVLGCTHYPLLRPLLRQVIGGDVHLVDSADAIAAEAATLLKAGGLANPQIGVPEYRFFVTDVPQRFQEVGERFLGQVLDNVHVVKI